MISWLGDDVWKLEEETQDYERPWQSFPDGNPPLPSKIPQTHFVPLLAHLDASIRMRGDAARLAQGRNWKPVS